jgi:arylsulfatase A-like enzyme
MHKFVGSKRRVLDTSTENLVRMNDSGIQISPEERNYLIALYDAEIAHLDSIFARFRQKLEQLDLYDSALIVFLSDHGEEFQDHGMLMHTARLYQELVHVPLVIKFPVESGIGSKSIAAPVALVDVMPTILSYFNIPAGTPLHGRNLLPMIQSKEDSARTIMTERNDVRMLALLDGSHKYIYNGKTGEEEIYDLKNDPHEEQNLIRSRQDLLDTFRKQRQDFVRRVEHYKKNKQSGGQTVVLSEEDEQNLLALGYVQ